MKKAPLVSVVIITYNHEQFIRDAVRSAFEQTYEPLEIIFSDDFSSDRTFEIIKEEDLKKFHIQENHELVIIDALLGVGIKGEVREPVSLGINYFNSLDGIKIAADIPSGINADTGEVCGKCCNCDSIITFHDQKVGLGVNKELKSKTIVVDIGIPVI